VGAVANRRHAEAGEQQEQDNVASHKRQPRDFRLFFSGDGNIIRLGSEARGKVMLDAVTRSKQSSNSKETDAQTFTSMREHNLVIRK
jgi:hypothetical protein